MADEQQQALTIDGEQDNAIDLSEHARRQGVNLRVTDQPQAQARRRRPHAPPTLTR